MFLAKHSLVCNQLGRFSFSKTFRPPDQDGNGGGGAGAAVGGRRRGIVSVGAGGGSLQTTLTPQTANIRTFLRGKYAAVKLFQVCFSNVRNVEQF